MKLKDGNKVNEIYKATLILVRLKGLSGFTMQAVAKEAKIATGTLYIYFENKETLVASLFDHCMRNSVAAFFRDYDETAPFKVGFAVIWSNIARHRIANFSESIFIEQCFHSPFINEATKMNMKKMFDPLYQLLQRGKDEHLIKDIDSFWLLSFMIGSINEIARRVHNFNKTISPEILDLNFKMCWDGVKA